MSHYRRGTAAATVIACVAMLFGTLGTATAVGAADEPVPGKLLLMLDASGSMKAKDPSGLTKIEAAKKALTGVVGALPDTAQVGLRVYGAKVDGKGKPTPAACSDTQLIHPIAALDKTKLTTTIAAIKALGETPIAHSLEEAMKDLGTEGKRNIVLVSDGEESCVPDPCPTVRKLTAAGVDLQIDTVGFGVNAKARKQLECIADAGKGTYYDAKDAGTLAASLNKLSQRALRPFTVSGTPVTAAATPESAPVLKPGQYTDTFTAGAPARFYRIERASGSTVRMSVSLRPPRNGDSNFDEISLNLRDDQGTDCGSDLANRVNLMGLAEVLVAHVSVSGEGETACATGPLVASVVRGKSGVGDQPVEVVVMEEPTVANVASLAPPVPLKDGDTITAPADGGVTPVVGGGGFSDAPTLESGMYTEIVLPGEQIFYRVRLDHGQHAAMTVDLPAPGTSHPRFEGADAAMFAVKAWTPDRSTFNHAFTTPPGTGTFWGKAPAVANNFIPEVRYRNREGDVLDVAPASIAGYYYFSIGREFENSASSANVPLTVRMRVAVEGEVTGQPAYAGTAPDVTASPNISPNSADDFASADATGSKTAEDGANLLVRLGPVAPLLLIGGAAVWFVRRRRSTHREAAPGA